MKKIALMVFILLVSASAAFSSAYEQINFQGILKDPQGHLISNPGVTIVFSIYSNQTTATNLWQETQTVSVEGGIYAVRLGSVNPIGSAVFDGSTRYLGIKIGTDNEMTPRLPLISVPYACRASIADTSNGVASNINLTTTGSISASAFYGDGSTLSNVVQLGPSAAQTTTNNYGVYVTGKLVGGNFSSTSGTGSGIIGNGSLFGGYFTATTVGLAATAQNYGGIFQGTGSSGFGIAATGVSGAGTFETTGDNSNAIYADNSGTTNANAIFGRASGAGFGAAIRGETSSPNGTGVTGLATDQSGTGTTYGVWGSLPNATNTKGYSGYFSGGRGIVITNCYSTVTSPSTAEGTIRFDSSLKHFFGYVGGGGWKQLDN